MFSLLIAWLAAVLTCFAIIPRVAEVIQHQPSTLSQRSLMVLFPASVLWTIHGFMQFDPALMFAAPVMVGSTGYLLYKMYTSSASGFGVTSAGRSVFSRSSGGNRHSGSNRQAPVQRSTSASSATGRTVLPHRSAYNKPRTSRR